MKIFSAAQVKEWDAYSIKNEPITSINLMERAATACYRWFVTDKPVRFFKTLQVS